MAAKRHVGWALAHAVLPATIAVLSASSVTGASRSVPVPQIDGPWWQVAGNPMDHKYATAKQEPVDFAVWQAADGTWQLWSCIRGTTAGGQGGKTRFFYRWEGKHLTDPNWSPMGIAMEADPSLGETAGGLQAPHVVKVHIRGSHLHFSHFPLTRTAGPDTLATVAGLRRVALGTIGQRVKALCGM